VQDGMQPKKNGMFQTLLKSQLLQNGNLKRIRQNYP